MSSCVTHVKLCCVKPLRAFSSYISTPPQDVDHRVSVHGDSLTAEYVWFRLRQLADVPEEGMALFAGGLAERREKYRYFRAFVHQAQVYWDAAGKTVGSAAALPYYYAILQLAKAELIITDPEKVIGQPIGHGLSHRNAPGTKIRQDRLLVKSGVFPLLHAKRTGSTWPVAAKPKVVSLLSLLPEIAMEMQVLSPTRPSSIEGYHAVAADQASAWSLLLFPGGLLDETERVVRRVRKGYDEVALKDLPNWRQVFAVSSRVYGGTARLFQAKNVHASSGAPDVRDALPDLYNYLGAHVTSPGKARGDFVLTPTVTKSDATVLPLPLTRYAVMFYLSSLVRYQPIKLDAVREGAQSYLMDSVVHELPPYLLASALDGMTARVSYWDPSVGRV